MTHRRSVARTLLQPLAIAVLLAVVVRAAVHIYSIPSASMAPTLMTGDQIVVTRYLTGEPQRGDIVVFQSPLEHGELLVKRIVGLPGDLVESRMGHVRIGGYTLAEPYVMQQASTGTIVPQVVPHDTYFVMGDNRTDSLDSRTWGVLPRPLILGRARMILWSATSLSADAARASTPPSSSAMPPLPHVHRVFKWLN